MKDWSKTVYSIDVGGNFWYRAFVSSIIYSILSKVSYDMLTSSSFYAVKSLRFYSESLKYTSITSVSS